MAKLQVIDPIELTKRIQDKIHGLMKTELGYPEPNISKLSVLNEVSEIVIDTLGEMTEEAKTEVLSHERRKTS